MEGRKGREEDGDERERERGREGRRGRRRERGRERQLCRGLAIPLSSTSLPRREDWRGARGW